MEIIPSIDLRSNSVVRLEQGDYAKQSVFSDDPIGIAQAYADAGAQRLHIVDLDGAKEGTPQHLGILQRLISEVKIPIQMGGGLRSSKSIERVISLGVDRVVLGTAAIQNPAMIKEMIATYGTHRIIVGLDGRNGFVSVDAWTHTTSIPIEHLLVTMNELGVSRFIYTDIARDGSLTSPNFAAIKSLLGLNSYSDTKDSGPQIIAAGGIMKMDDLKELAILGIEGAILGSALYRNTIDLRQAILELKEGELK
jgi:phosphoribosylformimino-5-aminoimidazole carboxamide ribotide isomerase